MSDDLESPVMERAVHLLRKGDTVAAEKVVVDAVRDAEARGGVVSHDYAIAQNDLGRVLMATGQVDCAIEAFRVAAAVDVPEDEQALRDRLTFQMNFGTLLTQLGELEEAEEVLQLCVGGREDFYGRAHAGYAFGLEPLAEVLLRKRNLEAALEASEECVANFLTNRHPRIATALALRAEIGVILGMSLLPEGEDGLGLEDLPDELIEEFASSMLSRLEQAGTKVGLGLLQGILPDFGRRLGSEHPLTLNLLAAISNVERIKGDFNAQAKTLETLIGAWQRAGLGEQVVHGQLGLALAFSNSGRHDEAQETYRKALAWAEDNGNDPLRSQILRNSGLHLAEVDRREEAEAMLRRSMEAVASEHAETRGRAQVALGLFLQHDARLDEARDLIKSALEVLDPADPDALCARSHLNAIDSGGSCGCGDMDQGWSEALQEMVAAQVPAELLDELRLTFDEEGKPDLQVELKREPTEEELEHLDRVVRHGLEEIRRRIRQRYGN